MLENWADGKKAVLLFAERTALTIIHVASMDFLQYQTHYCPSQGILPPSRLCHVMCEYVHDSEMPEWSCMCE